MKKYLLDFFKYNDWANRKMLGAINQIPDKDEAVKLFSHLIASLDKWTNRITKEKDDSLFNWFGIKYPLTELESMWTESINIWIKFTENINNLEEEFIYIRPDDGKKVSIKFKDLLLQLNYHSIHHRAQIYSIISKQGVKPPATDYIFTVLKEI